MLKWFFNLFRKKAPERVRTEPTSRVRQDPKQCACGSMTETQGTLNQGLDQPTCEVCGTKPVWPELAPRWKSSTTPPDERRRGPRSWQIPTREDHDALQARMNSRSRGSRPITSSTPAASRHASDSNHLLTGVLIGSALSSDDSSTHHRSDFDSDSSSDYSSSSFGSDSSSYGD